MSALVCHSSIEIRLKLLIGSSLSFAHCRSASTVILLLQNATFTSSIQPDLGLLRTRIPLASPINTLITILYSSFLSTCPKHLNTLSDALYSLTPFWCQIFYSPLHSYNSINSLHIQRTSQTIYLKNIHFPSLITSHTPCICSVQRRWYNYYFTCALVVLINPQSFTACSAHVAALTSLYTRHSFCVHPLTSSIRFHSRSQVHKIFHFLWRFAI